MGFIFTVDKVKSWTIFSGIFFVYVPPTPSEWLLRSFSN